MVKSDIQLVMHLFSIMRNIQIHGIIGYNLPLEWVSVEQIYQTMPKPKKTKDILRDFCESQTKLGNLEKRTGKDKETRQAKAEYKVSEPAKRTIALFSDPSFADIKNMITWKPQFKEKTKDRTEENPKVEY